MPVIARIPDVSEREKPTPRQRDEAPGRLARTRCRDGAVSRPPDAWPTWPVAALAVVAVATWFLASWKDHARLERQRGEVRLAREPAGQRVAPVPAPATDGAVFR